MYNRRGFPWFQVLLFTSLIAALGFAILEIRTTRNAVKDTADEMRLNSQSALKDIKIECPECPKCPKQRTVYKKRNCPTCPPQKVCPQRAMTTGMKSFKVNCVDGHDHLICEGHAVRCTMAHMDKRLECRIL